jgi:hypothetical protein
MATNVLTGEPLPHVEVWLLRKVSGHFASYRHTTTSRDGRFLLTGIEPGSYFVSGERNGYHRVDISPSTDPATISLSSAEDVKGIILKLAPNGVIAGRVVDAYGTPMEHVNVTAIGRVLTVPSETDDQGEFAIGGLLPGPYLVRASVKRLLATEIRKDGSVQPHYDVTYYPNSTTATNAASITVQAGQENSIEIKMLATPALHISGEIAGALNADYKPTVKLESLWENSRMSYVDEKGAFSFMQVPAGVYRLYAEGWTAEARYQSASVLIDLTNRSVENIHLTLLPLVELNGHIRDEDWEALRALRAKEKKEDAIEIRFQAFGFFPGTVYTGTLSDDGRFKIQDLPVGGYWVDITDAHGDFYLKKLQVEQHEFNDPYVEIGDGAAQKMLVEIGDNGAEISGTVRDNKGSFGHAVVYLLTSHGSFSAPAAAVRTSGDGSYVICGVAPGTYKLLALVAKGFYPYLSEELLQMNRSLIETGEVNAGDRLKIDLRVPAQ